MSLYDGEQLFGRFNNGVCARTLKLLAAAESVQHADGVQSVGFCAEDVLLSVADHRGVCAFELRKRISDHIRLFYARLVDRRARDQCKVL